MTPIATQDDLPWQETVVIVSVRPNSSNQTVTATNAGVYRVSFGEAAKSYGAYTAGDIKVTVNRSLGITPKPRDTVTWDATDYTILDVDGSNWLAFDRITARNLAISGDLNQTATVYRPSATPDSLGLRNPGLAAVYTSVSCRLQPQTREVEDDVTGRAVTRKKYLCYFASSVYLNAQDVIEVSGTRYEVTTQSEIESLSQLTAAECERIV